MRNTSFIYGTLALSLSVLFSACDRTTNRVEEVKVTFISNISSNPIFHWKIASEEKDYAQKAFQVIVSDKRDLIDRREGNLWDTGKREGNSSAQIEYGGSGLVGGQAYYLKLRVWDHKGSPTPWSKTVSFVVPLDYPADWKADWLTYAYTEAAPLPLFRKEFDLNALEDIEFARFYIAAPGYYEASLNGLKIGECVLDPGQTNYEDYTYYSVYDIDPSELSTENALGVMLGNGWYNQYQVWKGAAEYAPMVYGQPVFICQLVIHRKDGKIEVVGSGESWRWSPGPVTYSNVYGGEYYDARLEIKGWNQPGEPEGEWLAPENPEVHPVMLFEQFAEPIKAMDQIEVKEIIDRGDGTYIFDFGQNMAGWIRLKIEGEAGQEITVRTTEELDDKGNIDPRTTGVRATQVIQTQKYICKGEVTEEWEPRFTYMGFRYAEVSGLLQAPTMDLLTGIVLYSALPDVGDFQCSEENINKLHKLSRWTILGNIHSIPTDCPHREKCGWTGDAHAMIQAMIYNFDSQRFFSKYMFDIRSSGREEKEELYFGQSFHHRSMVMKPAGIPTMIVPGKRTSGVATPDWGTALVQIPWYLYLYYGERFLLEDFYSDMKVWVEYIHAKCEDGIVPHGLGDWCPPGGNVNIDCPVPLSSSAYHILDVSIMKKVSKLLGNEPDHTRYSEMLEQLKLDFNRHFFDSATHSYGSSQTANVMALDMDIVPEGMERKVCMAVIKDIREEHDGFLNTGIFGLARVFKVLSEHGYEDEVYRILTKTGNNSFAFMWDRYDVTTLWEVLPCNDNYEENAYLTSHSHPMQAGFDAWFYSGLGGINPSPAGPGFQQIEFKPYLTRHINSVSATYESKSGSIESTWEGGSNKFSWKIVIPGNSRGSIHVPTYGNQALIMLNGKRVKRVQEQDGFSQIGTYGPGEYLVEFSPISN